MTEEPTWAEIIEVPVIVGREINIGEDNPDINNDIVTFQNLRGRGKYTHDWGLRRRKVRR